MKLTYRPIERWPTARGKPRAHQFRASWDDTLRLLFDELEQIGAKDPVLQVDAEEKDFRVTDGHLRAGARLKSDAVILTFEHPDHGPLSYPCDTYATTARWQPGREQSDGSRSGGGYRDAPGWQANVRAIALTLQALRAVERYGAAQLGQQYTGWKQLGAGRPMLSESESMDENQAARFLADMAVVEVAGQTFRPWGPGGKGWAALFDPDEAQQAWMVAAKRLHPDRAVTGSADLFRKAQIAHQTLTGPKS